MKIIITLDYELFFGRSGTLEKCILEPTEHLAAICDKHRIRCVFFVDAGYLVKLQAYQAEFPELAEDYQRLRDQIKLLHDNGHDIQLHVHPHWEDTVYSNGEWQFDLTRYRPDRFSKADILDIFQRYQQAIMGITGNKPMAFRAGGWCIQPFSSLKDTFHDCNIRLDSTVFYKGKNENPRQWFDFSTAEDLDEWRFEDDPCVQDPDGSFLEVPIASHRVSPLFFWKFLAVKLSRLPEHRAFGDGSAGIHTKGYYYDLLTKYSYSVASVDGYKASFLDQAFRRYERSGKQNFVIIGHPKAFTPFSLRKLDAFIQQNKSHHEFSTFYDQLGK